MLRARRFMHEHVQVAQWSGLPTTGGGGVCQGTISTGIISPGGNFATFLNGDIFPSRNPPPPVLSVLEMLHCGTVRSPTVMPTSDRDMGELGRQQGIPPQGTIQGSTSNRLCLKHKRNCIHMALPADSLVPRPTPMGRPWLHARHHLLGNA